MLVLLGFSYAHPVNAKLIANRQDPVNHFRSYKPGKCLSRVSWANMPFASYSRCNRYIPYVTDCRGRDECSALNHVVGVVTIIQVRTFTAIGSSFVLHLIR
jgi:hypothetical protein